MARIVVVEVGRTEEGGRDEWLWWRRGIGEVKESMAGMK
jgi:hypothetical protein